jgi:hypothetical protein
MPAYSSASMNTPESHMFPYMHMPLQYTAADPASLEQWDGLQTYLKPWMEGISRSRTIGHSR